MKGDPLEDSKGAKSRSDHSTPKGSSWLITEVVVARAEDALGPTARRCSLLIGGSSCLIMTVLGGTGATMRCCCCCCCCCCCREDLESLSILGLLFSFSPVALVLLFVPRLLPVFLFADAPALSALMLFFVPPIPFSAWNRVAPAISVSYMLRVPDPPRTNMSRTSLSRQRLRCMRICIAESTLSRFLGGGRITDPRAARSASRFSEFAFGSVFTASRASIIMACLRLENS
mmetsp:Transcript_9339/g.18427  ORF Transcript_9339/g.18427 Transcript_9339/m.18427 type:complete len:231 (+) Transcript_9339:1934-2626(+)